MHNEVFSSNKPYLFRAIFEWLLDNNATPHILVDATKKFVDVPQGHIKDDRIVLNISPSAVQNWNVDDKAISFSARFSGTARQIYVPMAALMAIYAHENGQGMAFPTEEGELEDREIEVDDPSSDMVENSSDIVENDGQPVDNSTPGKTGDKKVSHLKIVK